MAPSLARMGSPSRPLSWQSATPTSSPVLKIHLLRSPYLSSVPAIEICTAPVGTCRLRLPAGSRARAATRTRDMTRDSARAGIALQVYAGGRPRGSRTLTAKAQRAGADSEPETDTQAQAQADAVRQAQAQVYQGVYGPWQVETHDRVEVALYRLGLNVTALSLLCAATPALLTSVGLPLPFPEAQSSLPLDALFWTGAGSLGLSLSLIHIYVAPIKKALQALWAVGILGALALSLSLSSGNAALLPFPLDPHSVLAPADAHSSSSSLVLYILSHPSAVWAVGPLFVSLTGLVFKEGLCYGKAEAALLVFIIPTLLLGHLSGLLDGASETPLLGAWVALFTIFALRKFTQPIKDDIGDKSVFMFQALPPEEQRKLLESLERMGSL